MLNIVETYINQDFKNNINTTKIRLEKMIMPDSKSPFISIEIIVHQTPNDIKSFLRAVGKELQEL